MRLSVVVPLYNEAESLATLHAELEPGRRRGGPGARRVPLRRRRQPGRLVGVVRRLSAARPEGPRPLVFGATSARPRPSPRALPPPPATSSSPSTPTSRTTPPRSPGCSTASARGSTSSAAGSVRRHDPWHKVYPSRVFNGLVSGLTGCRLHDHNCGFKAYRRRGPRRGPHLRRAPPVRARTGRRPRLPRRRDRGPPPGPPVWVVEVRRQPGS